jgi:hypothetical protein
MCLKKREPKGFRFLLYRQRKLRLFFAFVSDVQIYLLKEY